MLRQLLRRASRWQSAVIKRSPWLLWATLLVIPCTGTTMFVVSDASTIRVTVTFLGLESLLLGAMVALAVAFPGRGWAALADLSGGSGGILGIFVSSVATLLLFFAATYWAIAANDPGSFSEPLSRVDALYFAVTTFTTTGYGDIHAASGSARVAVTVQLVTGFVFVAVFLTTLLSRRTFVLPPVARSESADPSAWAPSPSTSPERDVS